MAMMTSIFPMFLGILQSSVLNDEDAYRRAVKEAFPVYNKLNMICHQLPNRSDEEM
ncbi:hypothetical protein HanIR_Chr16g0835811 [Helianthus annuus]|nr:hypothetical protein HanIR_Chr16g0835811 [Helianthus annuus]